MSKRILIRRVSNGWVVAPSPGLVREEIRDGVLVAKTTEELVELVREWADASAKPPEPPVRRKLPSRPPEEDIFNHDDEEGDA